MIFIKVFQVTFPYQLEFKDQENPNWICELLLRIYKHYSPRTKNKNWRVVFSRFLHCEFYHDEN